MKTTITATLFALLLSTATSAQNRPRLHEPQPLAGTKLSQSSGSRAVVRGLVAQRRDDYNSSNSNWIPNDSSTFTLNANAHRTNEIGLKYNSVNSTWREYFSQDLYPNTKGNNDSTLEKYWINHLNAFRNHSKGNTTFNSNLHFLSYVSFLWDTATTNWKNNQKKTYQPNAGGKSTYTVTQNWKASSSIWENYSDYKYVYGAAPDYLLLTDTGRRWNTVTSMWENDDAELYIYNSQGNDSIYTYFLWDAGTLIFKPYLRNTYSYNANNQASLVVSETYNSGTGLWTNSSRYTYAYDANGYLVNSIRQQWQSGNWVNSSQSLASFDADGNQLLYQYNNYNTTTSSFVPNFRFVYYYEDFEVSSIETSVNETSVVVYPNPSSSPVTFVNADKNIAYEVYDMQGRMIQKGDLQPGTNSVILNEAKGNYILKAGGSSTILVKQ